ncbi:PREDICTED: uncharacterized protein C17orf53 homolog [Chrysochloris asiatica]|uniref:Uncharacterized protein C17orf53 homolog n=1 Tax=Chrysochloris asiatica TaxID=185453 RepID=A0A9B0T6L4_CHRAS|nr:PREDICTED: uncharacterized protein C17orf53 homolog [Chrysochloris asiatica]
MRRKARSLQKLFAVEEDFEDEDFLSAVEDAENQFAGAQLVNAGSLRPISSKPQATVQVQPSGSPLSQPPAPSEPSGLGLCLPTSSISGAVRGLPTTRTTPLRPVSTSNSSWTENQRRGTLTEGSREPARPQSSAPCPLPTMRHAQRVVGGLEGPEQDEFDKVLASMELEEPGLELEVEISNEDKGTLPTWQREDKVFTKKARRTELSVSCSKGHLHATPGGQPLNPVVHRRTPQCHLRPGAPDNLPVPAASTVLTQQCHRGVCAQGPPLQAPQPLRTAGGLVQCSPQNPLSRQPLRSPGAWLSGKPRFPGPRTPSSGCSLSSVHLGFCPRGHLEPQAPVTSLESPVGTPKGPHSSLAPQTALQTPIVTNHLVQLVSAANRPPQLPTHTTTRTKTRRFPGPAGLLPHQQSGKNLEEIMVSMPQTPTHGALAKFPTEIVASSQTSVEEDFGRGPWLSMKSSLGLDERDPSCFLCTCSIIMVLRKAALKQLPRNKVPNMAVMIKSLTRSAMDASVVFRDPTGEMQGTVHRALLETRPNELKPGSVLLLKQIGVFSPSLRNHYLNVTPSNLVHIYSSDSADTNLRPSQPFPQDLGSFHGSPQHDVDAKSEVGLRPPQNPEVGTPLEEELSGADDLDGLLSELPEDFFSGTSSWDCPKAGHPP